MNFDIPPYLRRKPREQRVNVGRELGTALAALLAIVLWSVLLLAL